MGRAPCCDKVGLKKGPWTPEEDQKLISYIQQHGHGSWRALPQKAGLLRCGKSCRLRWANYLRPDIKRGKFTPQEEQTIIQLHALLGNRWSAIATHLPKRTDNEIKNYWNTHLKKRLLQMGIDPVTHKPRSDPLASPSAVCPPSSHISHMAQWESARLEAESRLVRESKLRARGLWPPPTAAPPGPAHKSATVGWGADSAAGAATVAVSEPLFTSYLGLLQHAMCAEKPPQIPLLPAAHVLSATSEGRGSTTDDGGGGDSFLNNCSSAAASEISDLSKTSEINNNNNNNINIIGSNGNRNMNVSSVKSEVALTEEFQALPNEEITSSTSNFSGDSLLDLVAPLTSEGANDDEDGDEDHKDYWSRMFNICSSPTHCTTNSPVHSIF